MASHVNPYLLTLPQLISARKKIGMVAAYYDPVLYSLEGFAAHELNPTEFREQLRRNFFITLTDAELGALVYYFDRDGDGKVNSSEFVHEFFKMGKRERRKIELSHQDERVRIDTAKQKIDQHRDAKFSAFAKTRIADKFTPEEKASAVDKVKKVAFEYDSFKGGLDEFLECDSMDPSEFREQLRRNFLIYLSPEETAGLIDEFDSNKDGRISCQEFMRNFFRLGRLERDRHAQIHASIQFKNRAFETQRLRDVESRFNQLVQATMVPSTEADAKSAFDKIKMAAFEYRKDAPFQDVRKSFECRELSPSAFKELLKANFGIYLSAGELDATMKLFDANGDGVISSSEFLSTFFRLGSDQRLKILEDKRKETIRLQLAQEILDQEIKEKFFKYSRTRVSWPVFPPEETGEESEGANCVGAEEPTTSGSRTSTADGRGGDLRKSMRGTVMLSPIDTSSLSQGASPRAAQSPEAGSTSLPSKRRSKGKYRKAGLADILSSPSKGSVSLKGGKEISFTTLFPKASEATKNFILEIEEKEREINDMRMSSKGSRLRAQSLSRRASTRPIAEGGGDGESS